MFALHGMDVLWIQELSKQFQTFQLGNSVARSARNILDVLLGLGMFQITPVQTRAVKNVYLVLTPLHFLIQNQIRIGLADKNPATPVLEAVNVLHMVSILGGD